MVEHSRFRAPVECQTSSWSLEPCEIRRSQFFSISPYFALKLDPKTCLLRLIPEWIQAPSFQPMSGCAPEDLPCRRPHASHPCNSVLGTMLGCNDWAERTVRTLGERRVLAKLAKLGMSRISPQQTCYPYSGAGKLHPIKTNRSRPSSGTSSLFKN